LRTSFPPDEYGMTKNDRIALQKSLTKSGFDTGGSDGVIGPKTIQAISDYQRSRGLAVTGKPTLSMIDK
jgi:membrane-bound lytic murein transglycosylase B